MSLFFLIDVSQVRIGMYIQLDVGWMRHPFPVNSFRITTQEQLDTLRSLNLAQVRWSPAKSDLAVQEESTAPQASSPERRADHWRARLGRWGLTWKN